MEPNGARGVGDPPKLSSVAMCRKLQRGELDGQTVSEAICAIVEREFEEQRERDEAARARLADQVGLPPSVLARNLIRAGLTREGSPAVARVVGEIGSRIDALRTELA